MKVRSFLVALPLCGLPAAAQNILLNPGFEDTSLGALVTSPGLQAWYDQGPLPASTITDTFARSGSQSLMITAGLDEAGSFVPYPSQTLPLPTENLGNRSWNWSFHAYLEETIPEETTFDVMFFLLDPEDNIVAASLTTIQSGSVPLGVWTEFSGSFEVGDLDDKAGYVFSVGVLGIAGASPVSIYFDDFSLAAGASVPPDSSSARITEVVRDGETTTVHFTTLPGFSYRLRGVDREEFSNPVMSWTSLPGEVLGDGGIRTLSDPSAAPARFYVVESTPVESAPGE